jgi:hypothetical protein
MNANGFPSTFPDVLLTLYFQSWVLSLLDCAYFVSSWNNLDDLTLTGIVSIWSFVAGAFCIILPVWESRKEMGHIICSAYKYFVKGMR